MKTDEIIKFLKNKNNRLLLVILIIGVVIMAVSGGVKEAKPSVDTDTKKEEAELSRILSKVDGAGKVDVMITYYGTSEKDIAYETKTNSSDGTKSSEDKKAVMSGGEPMVVRETYPRVKGVVITAQGAGNEKVKQRLTEAVIAALDIPEYRICICQGKE